MPLSKRQGIAIFDSAKRDLWTLFAVCFVPLLALWLVPTYPAISVVAYLLELLLAGYPVYVMVRWGDVLPALLFTGRSEGVNG